MDEPQGIRPAADRHVTGPLSPESARSLLDQGGALLEAGNFPEALATYQRVIGNDDPEVTAAGLLGTAQALYRMDQEDAAVARWEAVLELPETTSTYAAWRNVAAARVRDGDLNGAIAAYREADRRAPAIDKAEIANRLGWLAKETGNVRASRRYFARGRGSYLPVATYSILGLTVAVSLAAAFASNGVDIYHALWMDKVLLADGQVWRALTVTLVHGDPDPSALALTLVHLFSNMYALYLVGPIVERLYGPSRFVAFYVLAAIGGSLATFAFNDVQFGTGASGAIFGLFGVLFASTRLHMPVLDRQSRGIAGQVGALIVLNIVFGLSSGIVDNLAHIGGLVTGILLAVAFPPGKVPTLRSMWQPGSNGQIASGSILASPMARLGSIVLLVVLMAVAGFVGVSAWGPRG
jgi:membrane associated rhomboid family serine protease